MTSDRLLLRPLLCVSPRQVAVVPRGANCSDAGSVDLASGRSLVALSNFSVAPLNWTIPGDQNATIKYRVYYAPAGQQPYPLTTLPRAVPPNSSTISVAGVPEPGAVTLYLTAETKSGVQAFANFSWAASVEGVEPDQAVRYGKNARERCQQRPPPGAEARFLCVVDGAKLFGRYFKWACGRDTRGLDATLRCQVQSQRLAWLEDLNATFAETSQELLFREPASADDDTLQEWRNRRDDLTEALTQAVQLQVDGCGAAAPVSGRLSNAALDITGRVASPGKDPLVVSQAAADPLLGVLSVVVRGIGARPQEGTCNETGLADPSETAIGALSNLTAIGQNLAKGLQQLGTVGKPLISASPDCSIQAAAVRVSTTNVTKNAPGGESARCKVASAGAFLGGFEPLPLDALRAAGGGDAVIVTFNGVSGQNLTAYQQSPAAQAAAIAAGIAFFGTASLDVQRNDDSSRSLELTDLTAGIRFNIDVARPQPPRARFRPQHDSATPRATPADRTAHTRGLMPPTTSALPPSQAGMPVVNGQQAAYCSFLNETSKKIETAGCFAIPNPRPPGHEFGWNESLVNNLTSDGVMNRLWVVAGPLVRGCVDDFIACGDNRTSPRQKLFLNPWTPFVSGAVTCRPGDRGRVLRVFWGRDCALWQPGNNFSCFWNATVQARAAAMLFPPRPVASVLQGGTGPAPVPSRVSGGASPD